MALKLPRPETEGREGGLGEAPGRWAVMEEPHLRGGGVGRRRRTVMRTVVSTSA